MVRVLRDRPVLGAGLTLAAALMMSTAVLAQDASGEGDAAAADQGQVQNAHDLAPGAGDAGQGIAVGEPDPNAGGSSGDDGSDAGDDSGSDAGGDEPVSSIEDSMPPPDVVIDDGLVIGGIKDDPGLGDDAGGQDDGASDEGSDEADDGWTDENPPPDVVIDDGLVIGGWEDDPAGGDDGTGGDDGGADDGTSEDDGWVDDGTGDDDWSDDGAGDDSGADDGTSGDDDGWVGDGIGGDDGSVDDGSVDDSAGGHDGAGGDDGTIEDDGVVTIWYPDYGSSDFHTVIGEDGVVYYLFRDPTTCATCEGVTDYPMVTESPMEEIYQTTGGVGPEVLPMETPSSRSKPANGSFGVTALARGGNPAMSLTDCLAAYPELPWVCEWQFGADQ